jgi:hypothetical protein
MPNGHPSHYCLLTTVDSTDEQQVYCEGWGEQTGSAA